MSSYLPSGDLFHEKTWEAWPNLAEDAHGESAGVILMNAEPR